MVGKTLGVIAAMATLLLAGCLGDDDADPESAGQGATISPEDLPPGCDPARPAVAHHAGGEPAAAVVGPSWIPCESRIGTSSFEPTIGIDSDGRVFYYPASALGLPETVQMARSSDEGATWEILTPNVAGVPTHPYSQDPYLYLDPATDRLFAEDLLLVPPTCGMLSISDDGGETWQHTQSGCMQTDHVTIFAGPPATSSTMGYPNVIYRCAISGGAVSGASTMVSCQRSLDGGITWLPPGAPPWAFLPGAAKPLPGACDGGNGHGVVGPDGTVYLPRGHCGQPELAISTDEALTWTVVQVSDLGNACSPSLCEHDAGIGVDVDGHLYYAWVAADRLLYMVRSDDGGTTWNEPLLVGAPGLSETSLVQMAVDPVEPGRLALAYLGSSTSPGAPWDGDYAETTWDGHLALVTGAHTDDPFIHTATVNDPIDPLVRGPCGPFRCSVQFDFIDVAIGPDGSIWAPFVDGCLDTCVDGETNDGSQAIIGRLWAPPSP